METKACRILLILMVGSIIAVASLTPKESLFAAVKDNNEAEVIRILELQPKENRTKLLDSVDGGETLLFISIKLGYISMFQKLNQLGANLQRTINIHVNGKLLKGVTPLQYAQYLSKNDRRCKDSEHVWQGGENVCANIDSIITYINEQEANSTRTTGNSAGIFTENNGQWIYVGVAVGILLLVVVAVAVFCYKRKSRPTDDKTGLNTVPVHWISEGGRGSRHDSVNSLYADHPTTTLGIAQQRTSVHNSVNSLYAETNGTAQRRNSAHNSENSLYGATNGTAQRRNSAHNSENSLYGATNGNAQQHTAAYDTESGLYATID